LEKEIMGKITYSDHEITLETFSRSERTNEMRIHEFIQAVEALARQKRFKKLDFTVSSNNSCYTLDAEEWN